MTRTTYIGSPSANAFGIPRWSSSHMVRKA